MKAKKWSALVNGKEYTGELATVRAWFHEGRMKPKDQVRPPEGDWVAASECKLLKTPIMTCGLSVPYEILDSVFAIDSSTERILSIAGVDPNAAFEGAKEQLRLECRRLGGNAVICCQFEYRNALASTWVGNKQSLEIFAYGTAVRILSEAKSAVRGLEEDV